MFIPDQAGDIYGMEGHLGRAILILHEVHGHHDHPGNPEKDDVEAGHQDIRGVEGLQALGDFRPAQGAESPEGRTEPGVQDVVILLQLQIGGQAVFLSDFVFASSHVDVAVGVVPGRYPVAPP